VERMKLSMRGTKYCWCCDKRLGFAHDQCTFLFLLSDHENYKLWKVFIEVFLYMLLVTPLKVVYRGKEKNRFVQKSHR
jgi:hypothetical protein